MILFCLPAVSPCGKQDKDILQKIKDFGRSSHTSLGVTILAFFSFFEQRVLYNKFSTTRTCTNKPPVNHRGLLLIYVMIFTFVHVPAARISKYSDFHFLFHQLYLELHFSEYKDYLYQHFLYLLK